MSQSLFNVLVIEDDLRFGGLISRTLSASLRPLYRTEQARTLGAALDRIREGGFDGVVCDLGLPDSRGLDTLRELCPRERPFPVVVLTEFDDELTGLRAVREGAQDYLVKTEAEVSILPRVLAYAAQRKQDEQRIRKALELKKQFTAAVSHELRTPLTVIEECLGTVLDDPGQDESQNRRVLETARSNARRLAHLIQSVLDFQKFESGRGEFEWAPNYIDRIASEEAARIMPEVRRKKLQFVFENDSDLPPVRSDRVQIARVIHNWMSNAVKFTEKGEIRSRVFRDGRFVRFEVSDTGLGIREEDLPKLFQSYEQIVPPGTARKTGGIGLGLAIDRQIIRAHGGQVRVESTYGKGTVFSLSLPVSSAAADDFKMEYDR
ncbi:MAG: hybrid sensor histidine kinase/response regulator [Candidatus Omnitrophica bacterium]|nr:hybrid sensor histidine kinase/response regulator [Candidatus Omnitrophota bacterium]